jgi:hypothetical protein
LNAIFKLAPTLPISGGVAADSYFRFEERYTFDPDGIIEVLRGKYLGIVFRGVIGTHSADSLLQAFWRNPATTRRTDAPSRYLGTYHFNKSADTYLAETAEVADEVDRLVRMDGSPWVWFRDIMSERLSRDGAILRLAEMDGRKACSALIRSWNADGEFALYPHEDTSQCQDPRQAGFEVQRVAGHDVCAVNMCLANGEGGRLVMWNVRPDEVTRERLDVKYTGFSYPPAGLAGFSELRLGVGTGDIYVFNGAYVHAVETSHAVRANLSFFMGFRDEQTVVTWT